MAHIILNGQDKEIATPRLKDLVEQCCKDTRAVVAEVNEHIVKRAQWEDTPLRAGDRVELVTFMGGG